MPVSFDRMRSFVDRRALMRFNNGDEVVARLLYATKDMDGSLHLIYDNVEWSSGISEMATEKNTVFHAEGELLESIEDAAPREK